MTKQNSRQVSSPHQSVSAHGIFGSRSLILSAFLLAAVSLGIGYMMGSFASSSSESEAPSASRQLTKLHSARETGAYPQSSPVPHDSKKQEPATLAETSVQIMDIARRDPLEALNLAAKTDRHAEVMVEMVFEIWAETDPLAAAEHLLKNQTRYYVNDYEDGLQTEAAKIIAHKLVQLDVEKAFKWATSIGNIDNARTAIDEVVEGAARLSPETGLSLLERLNDQQRTGAILALAKSWGSSDFTKTLEWINTLEETDQAIALPGAISSLAKASPKQAVDYYQQILNEENDNHLFDVLRHDTVEALADGLAEHSLRSSVDWLATATSHEDIRLTELTSKMRKWLSEDFASASQWLERQIDGPAKDSALLSYIEVRGFRAKTAEESRDLAIFAQDSIQDVELREQAMINAMTAWAKHDEGGALSFAKNTDLTSDVLQEFYHNIGKPSPEF